MFTRTPEVCVFGVRVHLWCSLPACQRRPEVWFAITGFYTNNIGTFHYFLSLSFTILDIFSGGYAGRFLSLMGAHPLGAMK
jgi:hypothetical protein